MPAGILPKDFNFQNAVGGTSSASDTGASIKPFQYDPTNRGLNINIVGDAVGIGGGTQYTEDATAAANPIGNAVNLIRTDTPATQVTTDGDNIAQRGTNYGAAYVQLVTSAGAYIDSVGGGTQYTEDAAAAANPVGNALIVVREDARAGSLTTTDGDNVALRGNNLGELYVKHTDSIAVTGTFFQATQPISAASLPLPSGASTLAEQQTQTASLSVLDDWDETNRAAVNTIAGQVGVQGAAGASTALTQRVAIATDANAITAVGTIADDSTTPGAPVMVGGFAISPDGTTPGAVAEADVARFRTDLNRRLLINDEHPQWWSYHENSSSALTDAAVQADPGDGFQIVITSIVVSTGAATALNFFLEEGSTVIWGPDYLEAVAGRGFVSGPIKKHVTASTAVTITTSAAIAHSVDIQVYIQAV